MGAEDGRDNDKRRILKELEGSEKEIERILKACSKQKNPGRSFEAEMYEDISE